MAMSGFTKLFNSILHSTIWSEPNHVRILWITMLAMANKDGDVAASVPGLAKMAGISLEETEDALARFQQPDKYSRTPDFDGRRIQATDGGWHLLNHRKYREMASKDESREAEAKRKARYRDKLKRNEKSGTVPDKSHEVPKKQHIAEAEAEAEAEAKPKRVASAPSRFLKPSPQEVESYGATLNPPFTKSAEFVDFYDSKGWRVGNTPMKDWKAAVRTWHRKDSMPQLKAYSHPNSYNESTSLDHL